MRTISGTIEAMDRVGPREATFRLSGHTYRLTNGILVRKLLRMKKVGDKMEIVIDGTSDEPLEICTEN